MKPSLVFSSLTTTMLLFAATGCQPDAPPPLAMEALQQRLDVTFPSGSEVIGGTEPSPTLAMCLITSSEPLPLPIDPETGSPFGAIDDDERPEGTPLPISALLNLIAACELPEEKLPKIVEQRGASHAGELNGWQFLYREAATNDGWLTAIELHASEPEPGSS